MERNEPCRIIWIAVSSLKSLTEAHAQLTHMEVFIFIGNECYSYDAQDTFTRWLNNGVLKGVFGRKT